MVPQDLVNADQRVVSAFKRLLEYANVREQERWALALVKTYNKRRQVAYSTYLREFEEADVPEDARKHFDALLDQINQQKKATC